jgi:hypothetical protein
MPHFVHSDEVRPLNLEQQQKRAKDLRHALETGAADALRRFRTAHPKARNLADSEIVRRLAKLSEAQLVIARELGLPSWPLLRRHIRRHAEARAAVASGATQLDAAVPTTHIRCGTDIREGLVHAGLRGAFLEISEPYCQGPVPRDGDLIEIRARFIAASYDVPLDEARARLREAEAGLAASVGQERVVLWFEHDSFDQLVLARVLAHYAEHGAPRRLELVQVDRFPAVPRFHGLGELSPAALRMLWDERLPVRPDQLEFGRRVWHALRDPSPVALWEAAEASGPLPQMGPALRRHLQELPWRGDGLSLTMRLTLGLLAEGTANAGDLFRRLSMEREPLVHLGDSMYWVILDDLTRGDPAPLVARDDRPWPARQLALTSAGRAMLAGELDRLAGSPPERWVGGVRIAPGARIWRWDPAADQPRPD